MSSHVAGMVRLLDDNIVGIAGIGPVPVPAKASFPYITIQEIMGQELELLTGPSGAVRTIMQVNCWHKDYDAAYSLRGDIKDFMLGFRGPIVVASTSYGTIKAVNHKTDKEIYDGARELHQVIVQFSIWWES